MAFFSSLVSIAGLERAWGRMYGSTALLAVFLASAVPAQPRMDIRPPRPRADIRPPARAGHAMAWHGNRLVLFGGEGSSGLLGDTWQWDGTSWAQAAPAQSPSSRRFHAMKFDSQRNTAVLFGGEDSQGVLGDLWEWNGVSWTPIAPSGPRPSARSRHGMAMSWPVTDQLLLFGGDGLTGPAGTGPRGLLSDTWLWDGSQWTQVFPATSPSPRAAHAMAGLFDPTGSKGALLFGGLDAGGMVGDTWTFDWALQNWSLGSGPAPEPRLGSVMLEGTFPTFLLGGSTETGRNGDLWLFDSVRGAWAKAYANAITARSDFAWTVTPGNIVAFGGTGPFAPLDDTIEWNGSTWQVLSGPTTPTGISRFSGAVIGQNLTIDYTAAPNDTYFMLFGLPAAQPVSIPRHGVLHIDLTSLAVLYARPVPAGGVDSVVIPIPALSALAGLGVTVQPYQIPGGGSSTGIGLGNPKDLWFPCLRAICGPAHTVAVGSSAFSITGDMQVQTVEANEMGKPNDELVGPVAFQPITHYGYEGFVQLADPNNPGPQAEMEIDAGDVVNLDHRDPNRPHIQLPPLPGSVCGTRALHVCRDNSDPINKPNEFFLMLLDEDGHVRELTGSRVKDQVAPQPSMYRKQMAFTKNGLVGMAIARAPISTAADTIQLIRTDGSNWQNTAAQVVPATWGGSGTVLRIAYDGTLRIGDNGIGFVEGEAFPSTDTKARLYRIMLAWPYTYQEVTLPTGYANVPVHWSYGTWRMSMDGKTMVFPVGYDPTNSNTKMDIIAVTGIGGNESAINITNGVFPQITVFGNSTRSRGSLGAFSPDGKLFAFITGSNQSGTSAIQVYDFNNQTMTKVTAGAQTYGQLTWSTTRQLYFVEGTDGSMDEYRYDYNPTNPSNPSNITGTTGTLSILGSFVNRDRSAQFMLYGGANVIDPAQNGIYGIKLAAPVPVPVNVAGGKFTGPAAPDAVRLDSVRMSFRYAAQGSDAVSCVASTRDSSSGGLGPDYVLSFDASTPTLGVDTGMHAGTQLPRLRDLVMNGSHFAVVCDAGPGQYTFGSELWVWPKPQLSKFEPLRSGVMISQGNVLFDGSPANCGQKVCWVEGEALDSNPWSSRTPKYNARAMCVTHTVLGSNGSVWGTDFTRLTKAPTSGAVATGYEMILKVQ